MLTRSRRNDLFEEFIISLVGQTRELQIAVASISQDSEDLVNGPVTPQLLKASTPTVDRAIQGLPVAQMHRREQSIASSCCEQTSQSDLKLSATVTTPRSPRFSMPSPALTTPRSPRSLKMAPVPSPRVHTADVTFVANDSVRELMEDTISPYIFRGSEKRVLGRWERITRDIRNVSATQQLALLRSVWMLGQESRRSIKTRTFCGTRSNPSSPSAGDAGSGRMGDISKYEGIFLNHLVRHPDKFFTAAYIFMISIVAAYDLVSFPFVLIFETEKAPYRRLIMRLAWISAAIWSCDIPLSCFQGFYTPEGIVEMRPGHTCLQYFRSWFLLDILVNVTDWITCVQMNDNDSGILQFTRSLRVLRFLRIMRLLSSAEKMKAMVMEHLTSDYLLLVVRLMFLLLVILFISHYISCAWLALASNTLHGLDGSSWIQTENLQHSDPLVQYAASLHWCLTQFTPATTNISPTNGRERVFAVAVVVFGLVMFSTFVSSLTSAVVELTRIRSSRSAEEVEIKRYMKSKRVPLHICKQIWSYYKRHYRVRKRITNESTITFFQHMPAKLRRELRFNVYFPIVSRHPVFEHCCKTNDEAVFLICGTAVSEHLIDIGHEFFSVGGVGAYMFFLESGELSYNCQMCDESDKEVDAPHYIAEASLWTRWQHRGTLIAKTPCDVFRLSAAELEAMFSADQCWSSLDSVQGLRKYATLYAQRISDCDSCQDFSFEPITDLMLPPDALSAFASKAFGVGDAFGEKNPNTNVYQQTSPFGSDFLHYFRAGSWLQR